MKFSFFKLNFTKNFLPGPHSWQSHIVPAVRVLREQNSLLSGLRISKVKTVSRRHSFYLMLRGPDSNRGLEVMSLPRYHSSIPLCNLGLVCKFKLCKYLGGDVPLLHSYRICLDYYYFSFFKIVVNLLQKYISTFSPVMITNISVRVRQCTT